MIRGTAALLAALLLLVAPSPRPAAAAPARALCLVCSVTEGATEAEAVKAVRRHAGQEYGFCSEKCAQAFAADPAAYLPPEFPRPAPGFALVGLDGDTLSTERLKGQVVLLDFWATWCAPCRKSMPELQALHEKYSARGFRVVGVSIDEGGAGAVRKFVASHQITYPIAVDSDSTPAWDAYRVKVVPAAYLIDRGGNIVAQWTGASPKPRELQALLDSLLIAD